MKIAFLFSGQLRELEYDLFRKSLLNLTKDLDYAIFAYSWEEMGESLNHKNNLPEIFSIEHIDQKINLRETLFIPEKLMNFLDEFDSDTELINKKTIYIPETKNFYNESIISPLVVNLILSFIIIANPRLDFVVLSNN